MPGPGAAFSARVRMEPKSSGILGMLRRSRFNLGIVAPGLSPAPAALKGGATMFSSEAARVGFGRANMQHIEADQTMAVERYLLGDMTAEEVEQFEEHLFTCPECAESVKNGAVFVDNTRAVLGESAAQPEKESTRQIVPAKPSPWWDRFRILTFAPALAALALLCVAGYQQLVVIPSLRTQVAELSAPQGLSSFALHAVSRGAEQSIVVPVHAHFFNLYFDVAVASASGYSCVILDAAGSVRFTEHVAPPRPEAGGTLNLLIGRSSLPAGDYTLVVSVESPHPVEVGRYPFQVEYP
jgi:hypothetical protein